MKIAFFSDVHIANHKKLNDLPFFRDSAASGISVRCAVACSVLDRALETAKSLGCSDVFIEGDLFDGSRPEPAVLAHVMRILESNSELKINILLGNHEQYALDTGDHALGPLAFVKNVCIVLKNSSVDLKFSEVWQIPFMSAADFEVHLAGMFTSSKKKEKPFRILGCHLGIWDSATPAWGQVGTDSISIERLLELCRNYEIDAVMAGHWHRHVSWSAVKGVSIVQLGCLCPTDWRDAFDGAVGQIVVVDHDVKKKKLKIDTYEIPGPRFISCETASNAELKRINALHKEKNFVFARMTGTEENGGLKGAFDWLKERKDAEVILGFEALPDNQANQIQARTAATMARCETGLTEALAAFVKNMPIEDGVDRDKVFSLSKKYLKL